ncbi:MAG: hypothetical protein RQ745_10315, partial [Longimicrobiales bacterium]|nr:hypothetical protein [Longimicrobiales bacterium]
LGLLLGFDCLDASGRPEAGGAVDLAERLLRRGVLVLPAGPTGAVVELTPPATLTDEQMTFAAGAIDDALRDAGR